MKKISAILLSILMTATVFASCEKKESKDDKDNTSSTSDSVSNVNHGKLATEYTKKINEANFHMDMTLATASLGEVPVILSTKGENSYLKFNIMGMNTEMYVIGTDAYSLITDAKIYEKSENATIEEMGFSTFALDNSFELTQTKDEDGLTVEVYKTTVVDYNAEESISDETTSDDDTSAEDNSLTATYSYYFDADGVLKKVTIASDLENTTYTINSITFDVDDIKLPDLTDWVLRSEETNDDTELQIRVFLSIFGINEEALTEAGYTYKEIADLEQNELLKVLGELGVDEKTVSEKLGLNTSDDSLDESEDEENTESDEIAE